MIDVILFEPEIPHNTGAIARTCACTGASLHLIRPLGFDISDRWVKRAGLDYWHLVDLCVYENIEVFFEKFDALPWLATTKAKRRYDECDYSRGAAFMFGKETAGLPAGLLKQFPERCIRIPMISGARSLNLSNSAAVLVYEALRQQSFEDLQSKGTIKEDLSNEL